MKIRKIETGIDGLCVIEPQIYGDSRGFFFESYNKKEFVEILNKDFNTNLKVEELKDEAELDYLPLLEEEVFNFKNKIS